MGLLRKLLDREKTKDSRRSIKDPRKFDDHSCDSNGHDYQPKYRPHYYSSGVAHYSANEGFTVTKHIPEKCKNCGKFRERKEEVGEIHVDMETDELTVK